MPGPIFLPLRYPTADCEIRVERVDPANLAQYGVAREHPGAPPPRPGERPWVGKARTKRR